MEECKVLKVYSEKYAAQRPHKPTESRSSGNPEHSKAVEFDDNTQEFNTMENHSGHIPRKKQGIKVTTQEQNIKSVKVSAAEKGRTYGIDSLNLTDTAHAENDCVLGEENSDGHNSE